MSAPGSAAESGIIRLLADDVIDRIAAGEVIERPASVVKELVENTLDAGATTVEVHLEGGGCDRVVVSDDGSGMARIDAERAVLRHATSKLASADDLFHITTLGFRGEALSSIASVSRLAIATRRLADAVGTSVRVEGGVRVRVEEVGVPTGTTVDVQDLFFNTPARRKFLRSPATEQAHAAEAALRVVLGATGIGLTVAAGGRRLVDVPADLDVGARLQAALGPRAGAVYPFAHEAGGVRVRGYVTRPEIDRADAKGLWFFVNGRFVRDRMLQRALLDGYRSMVEKGRYPIAVIYIEVPPAAVDVNVHPQKLEVRFGDANSVYKAVVRAVSGVLARTPWLAAPAGPRQLAYRDRLLDTTRLGERRLDEWYAPGPGAGANAPRAWSAVAAEPDGSGAPIPEPAPVAGAQLESAVLLGTRAGFFGRLLPIGQALGLYLVCQGEDEIVIIDQHAAHERIAYERLRRQAEAGAVARQQLLLPEALDVPPRLAALLEDGATSLAEYGFEIEPVGPARFAVRAVPAALAGADARRLAVDLLDEVARLEDDGAGMGLAARAARARVLSRCACHAVVRAGDAVGIDEIRALLTALDEVDFGAACPHGRPVYHRVGRSELDRWFHRG